MSSARKPSPGDSLHGYPPRDPALCPGCDTYAEPFEKGHCWRCAKGYESAGTPLTAETAAKTGGR